MMQEIELVWLPPFCDLRSTELLISKFHSLSDPSSWPVATRQQLTRKAMQLSSLWSGADKTFRTSIFVESQSLMVLSSEQVMIFGSSGICSSVLYFSSSLYGSKAIILRIESVCPSISWVFYPIFILNACIYLSVKMNKMSPNTSIFLIFCFVTCFWIVYFSPM